MLQNQLVPPLTAVMPRKPLSWPSLLSQRNKRRPLERGRSTAATQVNKEFGHPEPLLCANHCHASSAWIRLLNPCNPLAYSQHGSVLWVLSASWHESPVCNSPEPPIFIVTSLLRLYFKKSWVFFPPSLLGCHFKTVHGMKDLDRHLRIHTGRYPFICSEL